MLKRWTLTATLLGLGAAFTACAAGETMVGTGGASTTSTTSTSATTSTTASTGGGGAGGGDTTSTTSTTTSTTSGTGGASLCGNGVRDPGEQCDGTDFGGKSCQSLGLGSGQLTCNTFCAIVATSCVPKESCTNAQDDNNNGLIDCDDPDCAGNSACVDSCTPYATATVPGFASGDTTGRPNAHHASCSTPGGDGSEQIFQIVSPGDGNLTVQVSPWFGSNFSVSVRTACADDASEIACTSKADPANFGELVLVIPVLTGQTYYVMVEGLTPVDKGGFSLNLDIPLPESVCDDYYDNDLDGYMDCDDATSCQSTPQCTPGTGAAGIACFASTQCAANHNDPICLNTGQFPGGYCSEFCDAVAQDCPTGSTCYTGLNLSKNGVCLQTCTADTDCRSAEGYACVDLGGGTKACMLGPETQCDDYQDNDQDGLYDCNDPSSCQTSSACTGGTKAAGQPCQKHNECFANKNDPVCLDEPHVGYPGGYCSQYCDPAITNDCGAAGICIPFGPNGENVCMATCTTSTQCRSGYFCQDFGYPKMICSF